jgi:acyl carrier protein
MTKEDILSKIQEILREELEQEGIVLKPETTASDVQGWDSLTHVQLISVIEKSFKVRFSSREIFQWKNVGEMVESLAVKV